MSSRDTKNPNRIHSPATTGTASRPAASNSNNTPTTESRTIDKRPRSPPSENDSKNMRARHTTEETKTFIKDENLPYMRELRKTYVNLKKADKQINYLSECLDNKITPKQLIPKMTPQTPTKPLVLQLTWQRVIINTGQQLTKTLLDYWKNYRQQLNEDIESLETELRNQLDKREIDLIIKICLEAQERYLANINRNAAKKKKEKQEIPQTNKKST